MLRAAQRNEADNDVAQFVAPRVGASGQWHRNATANIIQHNSHKRRITARRQLCHCHSDATIKIFGLLGALLEMYQQLIDATISIGCTQICDNNNNPNNNPNSNPN
jgi:hypothetical protein